jgi:hypothetical protein
MRLANCRMHSQIFDWDWTTVKNESTRIYRIIQVFYC